MSAEIGNKRARKKGTDRLRPLLLELEMIVLLLLDLELGHTLLPNLLNRVECIGEPVGGTIGGSAISSLARDEDDGNSPRRLEDLVKLLLERSGFAERPVGLLLVAEDDVLEDGLRDSEQTRNLGIDLAALGRNSVPLKSAKGVHRQDPSSSPSLSSAYLVVASVSLVFRQNPLERLHAERAGVFLGGDLEVPGDNHPLVVGVAEAKLDLSPDLGLSRELATNQK